MVSCALGGRGERQAGRLFGAWPDKGGGDRYQDRKSGHYLTGVGSLSCTPTIPEGPDSIWDSPVFRGGECGPGHSFGLAWMTCCPLVSLSLFVIHNGIAFLL